VIADQHRIRSRIEELKLSRNGYSRQLGGLALSPERRERLEVEVRLLDEEIATLEKIAQLGRVEPDRERVEAAVRERLEAVRARLAAEPAYADFPEEERDSASGEAKALLWVLGQDLLSRQMRTLLEGRDQSDPTRTDRAVSTILIHGLEHGPNVESRASAAYDLGKLHIVAAIPLLARVLDDKQREVAEMALRALTQFTDAELEGAGISHEALQRVSEARAR
jgi:hypothetical protein